MTTWLSGARPIRSSVVGRRITALGSRSRLGRGAATAGPLTAPAGAPPGPNPPPPGPNPPPATSPGSFFTAGCAGGEPPAPCAYRVGVGPGAYAASAGTG